MVEITRNQRVVNMPVPRNVLHGYPEIFECSIQTYTLDEIFSEKLHAVLENTKKIHERVWSRSRARDYYDLWRLLQDFYIELDAKTILNTLTQKCEGREVQYRNTNDFFDSKALALVKQDWEEWLAPMIHPLPPYERIINELKQKLQEFL